MTIVHPFFGVGGSSDRGGYELGSGAFKCVYENARVEEDELLLGLGTGFGAVVEDEDGDRVHEMVDWRGDSESEVLSQASSSPQSAEDWETK